MRTDIFIVELSISSLVVNIRRLWTLFGHMEMKNEEGDVVRALINKALHHWLQREMQVDNIAVIIIFLT